MDALIKYLKNTTKKDYVLSQENQNYYNSLLKQFKPMIYFWMNKLRREFPNHIELREMAHYDLFAQEIFLEVMIKLTNKYNEGPDSFSKYFLISTMHHYTRNVVTDFFNIKKYEHKKEMLRQNIDLEKTSYKQKEDGGDPPDIILHRKSTIELVERFILALKINDRNKKIAIDFFINEMNYAEISKKYEVSNVLVRKTIQRVRETMRNDNDFIESL